MDSYDYFWNRVLNIAKINIHARALWYRNLKHIDRDVKARNIVSRITE